MSHETGRKANEPEEYCGIAADYLGLPPTDPLVQQIAREAAREAELAAFNWLRQACHKIRR